jgi:hypothetical protein
MQTPFVRSFSALPSAHIHPDCGHARHIGTCSSCQRAQFARLAAHNQAAAAAARNWSRTRG